MLAACASVLVGCAATLAQAAEDQGVSRDSIVALSETYAVSARVVGDVVELVGFRSRDAQSWSVESIAAGDAGRMTAHLVTQEGTTGEEWNSFFFGTAPKAASRVVVDGIQGSGGQVTDGAWVIGFRQQGVVPAQLRWQVLDAAGAVIEAGTGITP